MKVGDIIRFTDEFKKKYDCQSSMGEYPITNIVDDVVSVDISDETCCIRPYNINAHINEVELIDEVERFIYANSLDNIPASIYSSHALATT